MSNFGIAPYPMSIRIFRLNCQWGQESRKDAFPIRSFTNGRESLENIDQKCAFFRRDPVGL